MVFNELDSLYGKDNWTKPSSSDADGEIVKFVRLLYQYRDVSCTTRNELWDYRRV